MGQFADIQKEVVIDAPIYSVWPFLATSEGLAKWFMPNTFEPVVGHAFVLHAGPYGDSPCKVTAVDPPYRVAFDWDEHWHLELALRPVNDAKTQLTLIHSGWMEEGVSPLGQPYSKVREVMDMGWERKLHESLPVLIREQA
ncbi:Activator of Hsp90 ATPase 1 family protein [Alicyclobacillus hesperidum URH17-3-68]|uniref:Activator of Hsp90 ATPase homologue 1/2-like C-terminal domain-containing protein n=1 Tax=Alicyclobacillus hesperidum TaxID=89784 RepID=A0AA37TYY2_9BACL|nr:SRPBCC domain-containing protein [Alicyclobacillus hesperidum]EJY55459.1 Activator of Hsp90 ATPase 1 family protein [Alicyclobacillus hesperidum URH17-3-68]GLV13247.1 hypothetical protein Heshes_09310 [Alicyclobacillus hesperidum]